MEVATTGRAHSEGHRDRRSHDALPGRIHWTSAPSAQLVIRGAHDRALLMPVNQ